MTYTDRKQLNQWYNDLLRERGFRMCGWEEAARMPNSIGYAKVETKFDQINKRHLAIVNILYYRDDTGMSDGFTQAEEKPTDFTLDELRTLCSQFVGSLEKIAPQLMNEPEELSPTGEST